MSDQPFGLPSGMCGGSGVADPGFFRAPVWLVLRGLGVSQFWVGLGVGRILLWGGGGV